MYKPAMRVKNLGAKSLAGFIEFESVIENAHVFIMIINPTKRAHKPCETGPFRLSVKLKKTITNIDEAIVC
jgi:hypothetical protein